MKHITDRKKSSADHFNRRVFFITLLVLGLAGVVPFSAAQSVPEALDGIVLETPKKLTPFKLASQGDKTFTVDQFDGKWSFVFFGYTNCPDICPNTLGELEKARPGLTPSPPREDNIQYVFVSVDPKRDTPTELAQYLSYFEAPFLGVTGELDQLKQFAQQVDIKFSYTEISKTQYFVNHSSAMILIDPEGRYYARFNAPHYAEDIVSIFKLIQGSKAGNL